jgi:hypothetical protein
MTLIAAAIAWVAVQRQIAIQQRIADQQTAIQQYTILQTTLAALQEERRLNEAIGLEGSNAADVEEELKCCITYRQGVAGILDHVQERSDVLKALTDEFDRASKNQWVVLDGGKANDSARRGLCSQTAT